MNKILFTTNVTRTECTTLGRPNHKGARCRCVVYMTHTLHGFIMIMTTKRSCKKYVCFVSLYVVNYHGLVETKIIGKILEYNRVQAKDKDAYRGKNVYYTTTTTLNTHISYVYLYNIHMTYMYVNCWYSQVRVEL